ncbi:hypothetical protein C1X79_20420, partial [Pseudomonas sp. FW305-42]
LRKTCVRPPEVAKLRAAPGLTQLSLAGYGARLLIGNGNGNGSIKGILSVRRRADVVGYHFSVT